MFLSKPWTNVFRNSFRFPPHGINLHTRTQIRFPNPWCFVVACTCSSNLNYGHYMDRNLFNVSKRSNQPQKISTLNMTFVFVRVNHRKKSRGVRGSDHGIIIKHAYCSLSEPRVFSWDAPICERCVSKLSSNMPIFLPRHLGTMSWHQARFHAFQIIFDFFGS